MAGSSLLALLDDIATLLDDISVMTKVAAKKTAGVLGDDLAVNAERVTGVRAERELPVVWAVAKGSAVNKLILVPAALLISAVLPWAVTPLLMLGGAYLCYEGFEKLWHFFTHRGSEAVEAHEELLEAAADPAVDLVAFEKRKIKGAIRKTYGAKGEEVVSSTGQRVKLSRPLDFLVVADHSDNMGFFPRLFAGEPELLADRAAPTLLTPHPGELARLLGVETAAVVADRRGLARRAAAAS